MAEVIDYDNLTLPTDTAVKASECIFKKAFFNPELTAVHDVITGVEQDRYIPIFGKLGMVGKLDPGGCNSNTVANQVPVSEKMWEPKLISGRIYHCQADLPDKLKFWKKSRIAANTWEEIDNEAKAFIEDQTLISIKESQIRIAEFSKKTHSPVGDGTGDELLTSGIDKTYFNVIDGMWAQLETDAALGVNAKGHRVTIDENAKSTKDLQLALSSDTALQVMRQMYDIIDPAAFDGQLSFQITKTLFDNWQTMLEDKSLVFSLQQTEQGSTRWQYRGIPIVVRYDWDRIIKTYFYNGTKYHLPHRALLVNKANIPIGTSDSESLTTLKNEYSSYHKQHYIDFAYKIDMKVLVENEIAYAF